MEKYSNLLSPALVLSVIKKEAPYQEEKCQEKQQINPALVMSCLNRAGQSSIFFNQSLHENLEDIREEEEYELEMKQEIFDDRETVNLLVENIIKSPIENVFGIVQLKVDVIYLPYSIYLPTVLVNLFKN